MTMTLPETRLGLVFETPYLYRLGPDTHPDDEDEDEEEDSDPFLEDDEDDVPGLFDPYLITSSGEPEEAEETPVDEEYNKGGYQDSADSDAPTQAAWNTEDE